MQYFIVVLLCILIFILFFKISSIHLGTSVSKGKVLDKSLLKNEVEKLAARSKTNRSGYGLGIYKIRKAINKCVKMICGKVKNGEELFRFEEELYDNFHMIKSLIKKLSLLQRRYISLPGIEGVPRIYAFTDLVVKSCGGKIDYALIKLMTDIYNSETKLNFKEIALLKETLQFSLLEYLAAVCLQVLEINRLMVKGAIDGVAGRIDLTSVGDNHYLYGLYKNVQDKNLSALKSICVENGVAAEARVDNFFADLSYVNGDVCESMTSIKKVTEEFDDEKILQLSSVYEYLMLRENIVFKKVTLATKFYYLNRISELAAKKKIQEITVAAETAEYAEMKNTDISERLLPKKASGWKGAVYIAAVTVFTAVGCVFSALWVERLRVAIALVNIPLIFIAMHILASFIVGNIRQSLYLPRLDLEKAEGDFSTMIIYTGLADSVQSVRELYSNLLTAVRANPQTCFSYGLLLDLKPSKEQNYSDAEREIIAEIHKICGECDKTHFNFFLRKRVKNQRKNKYEGWEKKRGAILDLNDLILSGDSQKFEIALGSSYRVKNVLTLDADSLINCAYETVQIMAHPHMEKTVILSLNMSSDPYRTTTRFGLLFNDSSGLDGYTSASAGVLRRLFNAPNYTGKGLYRVEQFNAALKDVFMDERILSHDFIEGAVAGAEESGLYGLDEYPPRISKYLLRAERWARGDVQLLPYLGSRIRNHSGDKIKNPVSYGAKFHIFLNLLSVLTPLCSLVNVMFFIFTLQWQCLMLAFIVQLTGTVLSLRLAVILHPSYFLRELFKLIYAVILLPSYAYYYTSALLKTLFRLARGKNLLDWTPSKIAVSPLALLPNLIAAFAVACVLFAGFSVAALTFTAVWMSALLLDAILCRSKISSVNGEDVEFCLAAAKRVWSYYEDMIAQPEFNGLPYDNFDENLGVYADRTSPTNIGFLITSLICAQNLHLIDAEFFNASVEKIINKLESMEKWEGLFYNWTEVTTSKTLEPRYVSAVDNGNLLLALTALSLRTPKNLQERSEKLAQDMNIKALFDDKRGLLRIGYNDSTREYDFNHYDLVSSEALATYLISIGLNKIDKAGFYNLDFERVRYAGDVYQSWTGGAFEFLMMPLFYSLPRGGIRLSVCNSVKAQIKYAKRKKLPVWGISESCFNRRDDSGNYTYKAFGVTDVAYSDYGEGSVVSPYSSVMALNFFPKKTMENLRKLKDLDYGKYGFYEAHDFERVGTVKSFMTHHLGMSLIALTDFVTEGKFYKALGESPAVRAGKLLLTLKRDDRPAKRKLRFKLKRVERALPSAELERMYDYPYFNLLGEKDYKVVIDETGSGYSLYRGVYINKYSERFDKFCVKLEHNGTIYDLYAGKAVHYPHKTEYRLSVKDFSALLTVEALTSGFGEVRQVEIFNKEDTPQTFKLMTFVDLALSGLREHLSHLTFSKMKLKSQYHYAVNAMTAERAGCKVQIAHFFDDTDAEFESNRQNYLYGTKKPSFGEVLDVVASGRLSFEVGAKSRTVKSVYLIAGEGNIADKIESVRELSFSREDKKSAFLNERETDLSAGKCFSRLYLGKVKKASLSGINGKYPVIALKLKSVAGKDALTSKLRYIKKLLSFGLNINVFVLFDEKFGYRAEMLECINSCLYESGFYNALGKESTLSVVNEEAERERAMRIYESAADLCGALTPVFNAQPREVQPLSPVKTEIQSVSYALDVGGFLSEGEYLIDAETKRCWSNVVCDDKFGFTITNNGGGYTYNDNSRQNKISQFSNDPLQDRPSESVVLGENGLVWSIARYPVKKNCDYAVVHGFGKSEFYCGYNGLSAKMSVYLNPGQNVKFYEVDLFNPQKFDRNIDLAFLLRPVMGDFSFETRRNMVIEKDGDCVSVKNNLSGKAAYIKCSHFISSFSDSFESVCTNLGEIVRIKNFTASGCTPCAVAGCSVRIKAGAKEKVVFTVGVNSKASPEDFAEAKQKTVQTFENLSFIRPDFKNNPALGFLMKWLPYQVYSSRFNGRTGFYQAGGAVGYRDQLQDCLTVLYINPKKVREHILLCAARQFPEGDVLHWWHDPRTGVRTKICDDKLFLPYLTAEYLSFTNDYTILSEIVPYLDGRPVPDSEPSLYFEAEVSDKSASLLKHCLDSIFSAFENMSEGLVLMGGGDWNDAMDKVGEKGSGLSVWCSMFLYYVISRFLPYVGDVAVKKRLLDEKLDLYEAVNKCFKGEWYIRAFKDDGSPVGVVENSECKIDLLTQSWAQISGAGEYDKTRSALKSAYRYLVDENNMVIKLLTPPFKIDNEVGYISSYPEGVRENGGQYTHAAAWYIRALFEAGHNREAIKLVNMINPVNHSKNGLSEIYEAEPYVMCGDVYSGQFAGQGGWSWYTGSASILYECIIKNLLGIKINGDRISVNPCITSEFGDVEISVQTRFGEVNIWILSENVTGKWEAVINGVRYNNTGLVISPELIGKKIVIRSQKC